MSQDLPALHVTAKTGQEKFRNKEERLSFSALDFWAWAASDMASNTIRGALAEFIVGKALGVDLKTRKEWDSCDLCTQDNIRVEVKSSSYCQTWPQKTYSKISFRIQPANKWEADTNVYVQEKKRWSDVYVFCVLKHKEKASLDPMALEQWEFYVVPTATVDALGDQKYLSLSGLKALTHRTTDFRGLKREVGWAAGFSAQS